MNHPSSLKLGLLLIRETVVIICGLGLFVIPEISEFLTSVYTFVGSFYSYLNSAIY